jgi:mono/diheme cytochrome c family protein
MRASALLAGVMLWAAALAGAGCGWEDISSYPCPPGGTTLTYASFGQAFFFKYCVQCHGGPNGYSSRSFTDLGTIRSQAADIFRNAAQDNTSMPPGPVDPPQSERYQLAEWLACGAPP